MEHPCSGRRGDAPPEPPFEENTTCTMIKIQEECLVKHSISNETSTQVPLEVSTPYLVSDPLRTTQTVKSSEREHRKDSDALDRIHEYTVTREKTD